MFQKVANTVNISHEEWLNLRRHGIGGSDVAAICGLSRWKSPMAVYLDKTDDGTGMVPYNAPAGEAAYWGTRMESLLADEFAQRNPRYKIEKVNYILQHPEYEWAIANVDRFIIDSETSSTGILECKTATEYLHHEWKDNKIPEYYTVQLQWYLFITGCTWGYFSVLVGGNKYYHIPVARDETLIENIKDICQAFWFDYVIPRTPPQFDGSAASSALIKKIYNSSEAGSAIDLPEEKFGDLIKQLLEAKKELAAWTIKHDEAENRIKEGIKENELAYYKGKLAFTWKSQDNNRFDVTRFQEAHPQLYAEFKPTGKETRKFLLKIGEVI